MEGGRPVICRHRIYRDGQSIEQAQCADCSGWWPMTHLDGGYCPTCAKAHRSVVALALEAAETFWRRLRPRHNPSVLVGGGR